MFKKSEKHKIIIVHALHAEEVFSFLNKIL